MGNKYSQTQEAKEKYDSTLFRYVKAVTENDPGHYFTKEELIKVLSTSDRMVRREIERMANYYPVVATSDRKGYRLVLFDESMDKETLESIKADYEHQLAELESRVNSLNARMMPLIAAKAEIEKAIERK